MNGPSIKQEGLTNQVKKRTRNKLGIIKKVVSRHLFTF